MPRADWSAPAKRPRLLVRLRNPSTLLYFAFLIGAAPSSAVSSSSARAPVALATSDAASGADASAPSEHSDTTDDAYDAELVRDAPLYPPLQDTLEDLSPLESLDNEPSYSELETSIEESQESVTVEAAPETDDETNVQTDVEERSSSERTKRSSDWEKNGKAEARVRTGDTILNIRGALRDAIGDAGAAPGSSAASRVDAFVIRPAHAARRPPAPAPAPPDARPPLAEPPRNENELLVAPHARVVIPCGLDNVTDVRWYKDNDQINVPPLPAGSVGGAEGVWRVGNDAVVGRATRADAGAWRCSGRGRARVSGRAVHLVIYEPVRAVWLAVDGRRLDAGNTWVPAKDRASLSVRCVAEGGVPAPRLSWKLLGALDPRAYLAVQPTNYSVAGACVSQAVVTAARELHNATLRCDATQRGITLEPGPDAGTEPGTKDTQQGTDPGAESGTTQATPKEPVVSAQLEIHVTYPPSFVISRWPGFGVSLTAGAAAALRCDVDANPPARAWWLRDDAPAPAPAPAPADAARGAATLRWPELRPDHAGWYRCRASWLDTDYSSIGYYLSVAPAPAPAPVVPPPPTQRVDVPLGGDVTLHCPKGSVGCWWRRIVGNETESWAPAGSHHAHGVLGIKEALYQEGGEYRCVGARAPDLQRLRELKRVTLKVTGGATATALSAQPAGAGGGWRLECGACGRGLRAWWLRAGAGLAARAVLRPDLPQHCWRAVLHVREPDEVWCVAATSEGGAVAVFPPRAAPEPARRALHAAGARAAAIPAFTLLPLLTLTRR